MKFGIAVLSGGSEHPSFFRRHLLPKVWAAWTLFQMRSLLSNWHEVWQSYKASEQPPPLRFKKGFTLQFGKKDDPITLLHEVFAEGCYREHLTGKPLDFVIDIGANIGAVVLDLTSRYPGARVHAYEPNVKTRESLLLNVRENGLSGRVDIFGEAVGAASGTMEFWTNTSSLLSRGNTAAAPEKDAVLTTVPVIDLKEAIDRAGRDRISLLKIDTEGAETDILEAAPASYLRRCQQIMVEYHDHISPKASERCSQVLRAAGFTVNLHPATDMQGILDAKAGLA